LSGSGPDTALSAGNATALWPGSALWVVAELWVHAEVWPGKLTVDREIDAFQGARFELVRLETGGEEPVEAEFLMPPKVFQWGEGKLLGKTWHGGHWFAFVDLAPGRYILRAEAPESLRHLEGAKAAFPFEVLEQPQNARDRANATRSTADLYMHMGEFRKAEELAWEIGRKYGREHLPGTLLADVYEELGDTERALEFLKAAIRRSPRPLEVGYGFIPRQFARLSVATGAAKTPKEGAKQWREFGEAVEAGKDTGELPRKYLEPLLREPGPGVTGGGSPLVVGVTTAVLVALGICAFLVWRSRRRRGIPGTRLDP
jgi:hypothetical protein